METETLVKRSVILSEELIVAIKAQAALTKREFSAELRVLAEEALKARGRK